MKNFIAPEMEISMFSFEDVITTSVVEKETLIVKETASPNGPGIFTNELEKGNYTF